MVRQKNFSKPRGLLYAWGKRVLQIATPSTDWQVDTIPCLIHNQSACDTLNTATHSHETDSNLIR